MAAQLFGVIPTDPLTFLLEPLAVIGIAVHAYFLPAHGATGQADGLTLLFNRNRFVGSYRPLIRARRP